MIAPEGTTADSQAGFATIQRAAQKTVSTYLEEMGLTDPVLIATLAEDCLTKARRRVGPEDKEKLVRRAIEEAQRRFDHALASAVGTAPLNDPKPIASARAAMLLSAKPGVANSLFSHDETTRAVALHTRESLPIPTPPEAPIDVPTVPLEFWLFKSGNQ